MLTRRIIITGTHHTPAIELIRQLKQDKQNHWKIDYIAHLFPAETHLSHTLIPKLGIKFHQLASGKFDRHSLLKTISGLPQTTTAVFKALSLIKKISPNIVVSFGGYTSVPVIFAAKLLSVPSITHEQTLTNSLSTKINALFVNKIALSFNNPKQKLQLPSSKIVITGNLLRQEIYYSTSHFFQKNIKNNANLPIIYVTGGNQGSSAINQTIFSLLNKLNSRFFTIHQTGTTDFPRFNQLRLKYQNYLPLEYINLPDIGWVFHHAALLISRSGANTCQEIVALGKSSILIPLPQSQQDEQLLNARWVRSVQKKSTAIINQNQLKPQRLYRTIIRLSKIKTHHRQKPSPNFALIKLIHEMV